MAGAEVERIRAVVWELLDAHLITEQGVQRMEKVLTEVSW
jgi:predicted RNA methylase